MSHEQKQPQTPYQRSLLEAAQKLEGAARKSKDEQARLILRRVVNLIRRQASNAPAEKVNKAIQNGCYTLADIRKETRLSVQLVTVCVKYLLALNKISVKQHRSANSKGRPSKLYVPNENE